MKTVLIIIFIFTFFIGKNMYQYGYDLSNAFWRVVWFIDEGTIWAPDFTEEGYNKVKIGMRKEDVIKLLGEPLYGKSNCSGKCYWAYTKQDSGTSDFDQRLVIFDINYRVTELRKSFFID